jgi:AAHS family 4-hydroxybenzoate transporter-like MFS transporter
MEDSAMMASVADRPLHIRVILLCTLVALLDGFDTQVIAYVAPVIAREWGHSPASFGPVFAAGPAGLAVGAFLLAPLADRVGRKRLIVVSTLIFGLFALLTAFARTIDHLIYVRFLTGIGLGAAMPNIIAHTGEFAPERWRATSITLMFGGLPLGSTIGGFISNWLMARHGWPSVFLVGGVLPLLLVPLLALFLPETRSGAALSGNAERTGNPVLRLFEGGRTPVTLLLWLVYFMNLLAIYFLVNWLPTLLREAGLPLDMAILSTAILNFGGAIGGVMLGLLIDRFHPPRVLLWAFVAAIVAVAGLAFSSGHLPALMIAAAIAGFTLVGAQTGCHVLTALSYPAAIRTTGVGWALGVGRIGAILGPLLGGMLLAAGWSPRDMILSAVLPALVALGAVLGLKRLFRQQA